MNANLWPLDSCGLYTKIIWQKKKDFGEIKKIWKYNQKNVYIRVVYNFLCVCVCVGMLIIFVCCTYRILGALRGYSWGSVGVLVMEVVLVWWIVLDEIYYEYGLKCESRCLFSCWHLDNISDFLFSSVFCDGWVIIASFSWRQRRNFFDVLL